MLCRAELNQLASLLAGLIERHCKVHTAVLIVVSEHSHIARFTRQILDHGYRQLVDILDMLDNPDALFKGRILSYRR